MYKRNLTTFSRSSFFLSWYNPPALFLVALYYTFGFLHSVVFTDTRNWWRVTAWNSKCSFHFRFPNCWFIHSSYSKWKDFTIDFEKMILSLRIVILTIFRPDQNFLMRLVTFNILSNFVHLILFHFHASPVIHASCNSILLIFRFLFR